MKPSLKFLTALFCTLVLTSFAHAKGKSASCQKEESSSKQAASEQVECGKQSKANDKHNKSNKSCSKQGQSFGKSCDKKGKHSQNTVDIESLSDAEKQTLVFMLKEEKLAHDVYTHLGELYPDVRPFKNIARSENRHYEAIQAILPTAELPEKGNYGDAELDALYNTLIPQGTRSAQDALAVGVAIEIKDIADLKEAIDSTDNAQLKQVYEKLLRASERHLKAFERKLKKS